MSLILMLVSVRRLKSLLLMKHLAIEDLILNGFTEKNLNLKFTPVITHILKVMILGIGIKLVKIGSRLLTLIIMDLLMLMVMDGLILVTGLNHKDLTECL